jgi:hypothetical protein
MKRIRPSTLTNRTFLSATVLALAAIASGSLGAAQRTDDWAVERAQQAVTDRLINVEGDPNLIVRFNGDARTESASLVNVRVRGTGTVTRSYDGMSRPFSYEALVNTRSSRVSGAGYGWTGNWYDAARTVRRAASSRLTGTYRLNPARSDAPAAIANGAIRNLPPAQQQRLRNALVRRLDTPEVLTIERDGRIVTIASSQAAPVTFEVSGREQIEQSRNGRQIRTTSMLVGDRLTVITQGDRAVDYEVTFEPIDGGRGLRVTRRVTHENLLQPVVARSIYDRTSDAAQFDFPRSARRPVRPGDTGEDGFIVPDGTEMVAVLNEELTTEQSREGDRLSLTVRSPSQFADSLIEGYLVRVDRPGELTGRAEMAFDFDSIRLSNGRRYEFAGYIERIRTPEDQDGDTVRVDREGTVQDEDSQTERTVMRSGIGAAIGAVIGAITGGGKGAAIGAAIGAGAGAGSVFIQGREDLELTSGTEFWIRARAGE